MNGTSQKGKKSLWTSGIVSGALWDCVLKLNPITLMKNPVMFVVEVGAALTTVFLVRDVFTGAGGIGFSLQIALWLWFTVLFANFAEAWRKRVEKLRRIPCAKPRRT